MSGNRRPCCARGGRGRTVSWCAGISCVQMGRRGCQNEPGTGQMLRLRMGQVDHLLTVSRVDS